MRYPAAKQAIGLIPLLTATLMLATLLCLASTAVATTADSQQVTAGSDYFGWVVTTDTSDDGGIWLVNGQNQEMIGPLLQDALGEHPGGAINVEITADGKTALVSNYADYAVYFVDVSTPPTLTIDHSLPLSASMPMHVMDIAIMADGRYAVASSGYDGEYLVTLDLLTHTPVFTLDMSSLSPPHYATMVAAAPGGMVIYADHSGSEVGTLMIDESGQLTHTSAYTYQIGDYPPMPVNLYVAPDEQTVIVSDSFSPTLSIFRIEASGDLSFTGFVHHLNTGGAHNDMPGVQSLAFNPANNLFYAVVNGRNDEAFDDLPDQVAVLEVQTPGKVRLLQPGAADLPRSTQGRLHGVDTAAVLGGNLYLGYPSSMDDELPYSLVKVNLATMTAEQIPIDGYPTSMAVIPIRALQTFLPLVDR